MFYEREWMFQYNHMGNVMVGDDVRKTFEYSYICSYISIVQRESDRFELTAMCFIFRFLICSFMCSSGWIVQQNRNIAIRIELIFSFLFRVVFSSICLFDEMLNSVKTSRIRVYHLMAKNGCFRKWMKKKCFSKERKSFP